MPKSILGKILTVIILLAFALKIFSFASAQTVSSCIPGDNVCQAALEADLASVENEIKLQTTLLESKQKEGVSLERDMAILTAQIQKAKLQIKAQQISIAKLTEDIGSKNKTIVKYSAKIDSEHESLAGLLRRTNEIDSSSLIEVALSDKNISDFFSDLDNFEYIEDAIGDSLDIVSAAKKTTEEAKATLEEKKNKEMDLKHAQEVEQASLTSKEKEKARLLKVTKGQEALYQKVLKEKKAKASQIRAALFALRDTGEIQFGQAYDYAKTVSLKTGVRPAFLLAIFMQESGFGKNQGSCYLKDPLTGAGVGKNTGKVFAKVMAVMRKNNPNLGDVKPFLDITERLGLDPFMTQVSCPQSSGYGGAMGPAQFIPSTWVLYENRITKALGISTANPWLARDAFMAAGFLLKDNGAVATSYSAERNAACKYFSGSSCANSSWASTYGTQVMQKADTIQTTMIDPIENL
ncbi:MAG: lytic murein transglycosylase [Candidatus Paceibacterota bacterium]|jgi:membrane-bound lytic murein transglycosylase B